MIENSLVGRANKIVIKIGSSLLINQNKFNSSWLLDFIDDVILLLEKKKTNRNCCIGSRFTWKEIFKYKTKEN